MSQDLSSVAVLIGALRVKSRQHFQDKIELVGYFLFV